jgi:hypothetical protein
MSVRGASLQFLFPGPQSFVILSIFSCVIDHLFFLGKMSIVELAQDFVFLLFLRFFLYIMDINS